MGRGGFPLRHPSPPLQLHHSNPKAEVCKATLGPEGVFGLCPHPSLPTTPKNTLAKGYLFTLKAPGVLK